ncbi:MAG: HlyC/CorC family transporter [Verrucomicrobia bacterium]|nr:HlyC/CorC family transporter [Verrucomicrobiota bacterium]
MSHAITEIVIIGLLLVANGVFAMTEMAVIASRKARLRRLAKAGDTRARMALELVESPNRFLSTVQIGITLVGVMAGAFGGATVADQLRQWLTQFPVVAPYAHGLGIAVVVLGITYGSLVIGELVPKRLALGNPEGIARAMAGIMNRLSRLASPAVKLLSVSTDWVLRGLGVNPASRPLVSEEELKVLLQEGLESGVFLKTESEMVESVLALDRLPVREIMTPRPKIIWINRDDSHDAIWHKIVVSGHSHYPVYTGHRDNVIGLVSVKAVYANLAAGVGVRVADLMTPPLIVPAVQTVTQLLETFKHSRTHVALAADEFGSIVGLVTLNDVMEAIVGDFPTQHERLQPAAKRRDDGSWLIDGMFEIDKLEAALPGFRSPDPGNQEYQTIAGFVVKQLGHVPKEGETFEAQGYVFEVLDMDRYRVDKVFVMPARPGGRGSAS